MENNKFNIEIDLNTGYVTEISNPQDEYKMNWCSGITQWGKINLSSRKSTEYHNRLQKELVLKEISVKEDCSKAVFENNLYRICVNRSFKDNGNFTEQITVKNITDTVICINRDNFGIAFPFNDMYSYADECLTNRCNTHIWCGYNSSWVNALKMGESEINLGLFLKKGSFVSYSQYNCESNIRGYFELEPETVLLNKGQEYVLEWELFWHKGGKDFFNKLCEFEGYIGINSKHFTVFEGEKINFLITPHNHKTPIVYCDETQISVNKVDGGYEVEYLPVRLGEHKFIIKCGNVSTFAEFNVKIPFAKFVKNRVHFIVDKQQCLDKSSPLYGAYLLYDNETQSQYFDFYNTDHNACRERANMPLTLIKYLQFNDDSKVRKSIDLYIEFLFREFYEEKTGEVFNNIGKSRDALRLYNAPGVMLIFAEMYHLTADEKYLDNILKLADKYYSIGGENCYSNAVQIRMVLTAFEKADRKSDFERMYEYFKMHTDNMIKIGTSYPKHEVNYEQTIVTPAVNCISEMGLYSEDKDYYNDNAKMHLECLERFSGQQPSFHLNEIAIRFWDDFWFGKSKQFGDTLPHHLSCLTARAFISYARLSGEKEYISRAEECVRNCFSLISDEGKGSAAYVYPNTVNGSKGSFYDGWANDQDLSLYDAMNFSDLVNTFKFEKS